jgi:hypothetical protein
MCLMIFLVYMSERYSHVGRQVNPGSAVVSGTKLSVDKGHGLGLKSDRFAEGAVPAI